MENKKLILTRSMFALLLLFFALPCALAWPNGPDEDPQESPPNDPGYSGQWNLWSFVPEEWTKNEGFRQDEVAMGTGLHADRAWQRTIGDRRVVVAVLDSGIRWDKSDLMGKHYLNKGELENYKPAKVNDDDDDWDINGDGVFNLYDYLVADPDFGDDKDTNSNGKFDPGDLIFLASDGVDDDQNGYIDDVSGWDFMWNDNDPYDDTDFGHGTGEAYDSVAEGNNGDGSIGVCPECSLLNVRVGDSFVVDANDFAMGVIFAVDSGAHVIQEALGSINNTSLSRDAIEYAYSNHVAVVASAADELSFHHNFPGTNNHTLYVHAIVFDSNKPENSTTFLNFNNCTNYGGQLLLSTPGTGCSSEATGITAGHVGLMYSAAFQAELDPPMTSEEVRGILVMSADDIDVPESATDETKFPSGPGWDLHFGYGRNNARGSVDMIFDDRIPPEVDIVSPKWFETILVDRTPEVEIEGRIGFRVDSEEPRYESYEWDMEVALGIDPKVGWTVIDSGTTQGEEGVIGTWNAQETFAELNLEGPVDEAHRNAVTVRIKVRANNAAGELLENEFRKSFFVAEDPDLHPAFPIYLGTSGESSPKFADLDSDGTEELIIATADGHVHAFKADATEAEGWPVSLSYRPDMDPENAGAEGFFGMGNHRDSCAFREEKEGCKRTAGVLGTDIRETVLATPAVGDLTGDGDLEVVLLTWDGSIHVLEHDGSMAEGFPLKTDLSLSMGTTDRDHLVDHGFFSSPVLADLDDDGNLEIIAAAMDQHIYVFRHDGTAQEGWPLRVRDPKNADKSDRIMCTPAVGDVNGDGLLDIVTGTNETFGAGGAENESRAYVIHGDGNLHEGGAFHEGWPIALYGLQDNVLPVVGRGTPGNPILADLDYDGTLEIAVEAISSSGYIYNHDGSEYRIMNNQVYGEFAETDDAPLYLLINNGVFARFDNEGAIDYLKGGAGFGFAKTFVAGGLRVGFDHQLGAWDTLTGKMLPHWPRVMDDWQFFMNPVVADLDGDNKVEVINTSGGYRVHAWNSEAVQPAGWPKSTGGWNITSPAIGDLDGDGTFDVAVASRNGWLFSWSTPGSTDGIVEWQFFGHDHHNTNNYDTPIPIYGTSGSGPSDREDTPIDEADAGSESGDDDSDASAGSESGDEKNGPESGESGEEAETDSDTDEAAGTEESGDSIAASGGDDGGCDHQKSGPIAPVWMLFTLLVIVGLPRLSRRGS